MVEKMNVLDNIQSVQISYIAATQELWFKTIQRHGCLFSEVCSMTNNAQVNILSRFGLVHEHQLEFLLQSYTYCKILNLVEP